MEDFKHTAKLVIFFFSFGNMGICCTWVYVKVSEDFSKKTSIAAGV